VISDNGNYIIDCAFGPLDNPEELESSLAQIIGVVESGLFTGFTKKTRVIVGD